MSVNYNFDSLQSLLSVDGNINAIIIALITVGLITIITIMNYSFENILHGSHSIGYRLTFELIEAIVLAIGMVLVQHIFKAINSGDMRSWFYATTQLTLLLYSLYTMHNRIIEIMNIIAPIYIFGYRALTGYNNYLLLFAISTVMLALTVIYIYRHTDLILSSQWRFIVLQVMYGAFWWAIIWPFHKFTLSYTINMIVGFIAYMYLIRYLAKWIRNSFKNYNNLSEKVNYDELTGIRNRANFDSASKEVFNVYSKEPDVPLTIAMFDIDHFKSFNDTYGHLAGDKVLRHVATYFEHQLFKQTTRGQLFRYGGEEFVIIFRGLTADESASIIREIRNGLINDPLEYNGKELNIKVSFGVTELQESDKSFRELFSRVDKYLYESKDSGRNRMTVENKIVSFEKFF
ncbi:GGDEF domain-containing protein [Companilactobacillus insicii]|uniref:GGDEF domain-containing protein n=1 Tax=Companilactobacillus insicii TaxID=1732567 RepID=UPI000F779DBE|nr:GGDEF domain-containing protein [Companilactobacillus insicii]